MIMKWHNRRLRSFLIVPVNSSVCFENFSYCAQEMINSFKKMSQSFVGRPVELLGINLIEKEILRIYDGRKIPLSDFYDMGSYIIMNSRFLLFDRPEIPKLIRQAEQRGMACFAAKSAKDTYAFAFVKKSVDRQMAGLKIDLWSIFSHLSACIDNDVEKAWEDILQIPILSPDISFIENSPAMRGIPDMWCKRLGDSSRYINTAINEIISNPQCNENIEKNPLKMAFALSAQRKISKVPWYFNSLINEIEYRMGSIKPFSFPPEIHISTTGLCNVECRFCNYTHTIARRDFVTPHQIHNLTFLHNVRTLRLHSGHGEPLVNPHLSEIIRQISHQFPHLSINFFSNGINLNHNLIKRIIGDVKHINISLNAANSFTYKIQTQSDNFDLICGNLQNLLNEKRSTGSLFPLVYGSMVLNRTNLADLPEMPELCHKLGIDRFTAFPYFALGYKNTDKFGPDMTLESCRELYDNVYCETIKEAEKNCISIEIPPPSSKRQTAFGLEVRPFYDFACIESNEYPYSRLISSLKYDELHGAYCPSLWRTFSIGSTYNIGHSENETHFCYPCIGPLSGVDLSRPNAFKFQKEMNFFELWNNRVFTHLRNAQHELGVCKVCDICRQSNTRDPKGFADLEKLVGEFRAEYELADKD